MSDNHEVVDETRRDLIKSAGRVAWIVPAMQAVAMPAATTGEVAGSVVTGNPPVQS